MGNACYYSVEKLLSSSLLSKNLKVRIYKTVILPVVLYGCETWTLTLREEQRLRVFENKMLRKIFGAKRDEVTGEWRKLHNTELHALYSSPDIIRNIKSRRLRWAGHVARMGESRNAYRVLDGRPEGKRPLGRPRRRWEDNIKMDLREVGYDDREWINFAQDRDQWRAYVRAAMNLRNDTETDEEEKKELLGHWLRRSFLQKDALEGMVNRRRVRDRRIYQYATEEYYCKILDIRVVCNALVCVYRQASLFELARFCLDMPMKKKTGIHHIIELSSKFTIWVGKEDADPLSARLKERDGIIGIQCTSVSCSLLRFLILPVKSSVLFFCYFSPDPLLRAPNSFALSVEVAYSCRHQLSRSGERSVATFLMDDSSELETGNPRLRPTSLCRIQDSVLPLPRLTSRRFNTPEELAVPISFCPFIG
ncbi:hypothetical protein ANN_24368 [Periplaneta americana]|uniref:Uncharacterized protein n=1 Tax=Periplaneta americana TaxID=6978 RepID=A0ABQ8S2W3_PERAM|nr:hypothetical protein ANN_24368 [Periplaneta americana]